MGNERKPNFLTEGWRVEGGAEAEAVAGAEAEVDAGAEAEVDAEVDAVEEVVALEVALLTPQVRRSRARLEELLDPEFAEIGASGRLWERAAIIGMLVAGEDRDRFHADWAPLPTAEMAGRWVASELVLLTYVSDPGGRAARRSSLWRRSGSSWRMLFHQGTLL